MTEDVRGISGLIDQGYYEEAISAIKQCLRIENVSAKRAVLLKEMGYCFLRLGWFENAVPLFTQYLEAFPGDNDARFYLASAYASLKWTDESIKELRTILASDPTDLLSHHDLAMCYRDKGWLKESLEVMKRANAHAMIYGDPVERELIENGLVNLEHENENGGDNNFKNFLLFMILLLILMKKKQIGSKRGRFKK